MEDGPQNRLLLWSYLGMSERGAVHDRQERAFYEAQTQQRNPGRRYRLLKYCHPTFQV